MDFATSYFGNRIVRHVRVDMRRLRSEGFGIVVHTFSEHDLRYYRDTMTGIVAASHEAGMRVWLDPWGLGGVFGGEAFSDVALREPGWAQISAAGSRLPACCPSHPGFRGFVDDWIGACLDADADGVFWDEPHFFAGAGAEATGCSCEHCGAISAATDRQGPARRREAALLAFLLWGCGRVADGGGRNVVCLLPRDRSAEGRVSWDSVARASGLVSLGSVPFWALHGEDPEACITRSAKELRATTTKAGVQSHLWIQGFRIPAGREREIAVAMHAAARAAVDVIGGVWGFDACASMSFLACERPAVAWKTVVDGIHEVLGKSGSAS